MPKYSSPTTKIPRPTRAELEQLVSQLVWQVRFAESQRRCNRPGQWSDPHRQRLNWRNQYLVDRVRQLEAALSISDATGQPPA